MQTLTTKPRKWPLIILLPLALLMAMVTPAFQDSPWQFKAWAMASDTPSKLESALRQVLPSELLPNDQRPPPELVKWSEVALQEIPPELLTQYPKAVAKECPGLPVQVLAGLGFIESHHGRLLNGATLGSDGEVTPWIIGPDLDGVNFALIIDTDQGKWDRDTKHDRAVGPFQFLPATWEHYAADGNGDGKKSPHNLYDALYGAAKMLCRNGGDQPDDPTSLGNTLFRYNPSCQYGRDVLAAAKSYGLSASTRIICPA